MILGILLSVLTIMIWIFTTPYGFPWPIYPIWAILIIDSFLFIQLLQVTEKYFIFHFTFFLLNSIVLFLSNVYIKYTNFPWAMYPIGILFTVFMIHTLLLFEIFDFFRFHILIYFILNTFCLWTWSFMKVWFPWWVIIFGFTTILLIIHLLVYKCYQKK